MAQSRGLQSLTSREQEVVSAVVAGHSNREIADCLQMGEDTVKHHLSNIFYQLGVSTRTELRRVVNNEPKQEIAWDSREDRPLAFNLPALVLALITLAIFAAAAYGLLRLIAPLVRFIFRIFGV